MPLVVVGLDHRSASADVFKRATIPSDQLDSALDRLAKSDHFNEVVVLSTCLRTEIYVDAVRFHGAIADLRAFFSELTEMPVDEISNCLVERYDEAACTHLFSLAAGVESMMLGEGEILGQLGRSWQASQLHGNSRSVLNGLFRHALVAGKRARNETHVGAGITSIGTAAVSLAGDRVQGLDDKSVLVVGAGEVATKVALAARKQGAKKISVANRSASKASDLAARVRGDVVDLTEALRRYDVVITATASPEAIVHAVDIGEQPVVIVDLGVPQDVSEDVVDLERATVLRLDDVQSFVNQTQSKRLAEVDRVRGIVDDEVRRYFADVNARVVAPLLRELHERADLIRDLEFQRFGGRLSTLDATQRKAVEEMTSAFVAKLFHDPTIALKMSAGTPEGERMAEAVRRLFNL